MFIGPNKKEVIPKTEEVCSVLSTNGVFDNSYVLLQSDTIPADVLC